MSAPGATYDSSAHPPAPLAELAAVWRYRDLVLQLVSRDIKTRYKRSLLGVAWTMVNPLLTMTVLAIVFGQIFRVETHNYPAYLLSGVLVWNFFAQSTSAAMHQLVSGGSLFRRIYVPRTVFTLAAVGTGLVNFVVALVPLVVIMAVTGAPFTPALIWVLVVAVPVVAIFTLGVALLLSTLSITFPDVIEMYVIVLNAWFFLTPVMYPLSIVPDSWVPLVVANPMFYFVASFRTPVQDGAIPDVSVALISVAAALTSLVIGWLAFTSRADRIAYRV